MHGTGNKTGNNAGADVNHEDVHLRQRIIENIGTCVSYEIFKYGLTASLC